MIRLLLSALLFAVLCFTPITSVGQQPVKEKYEPVSASEFNAAMEGKVHIKGQVLQ